MFSKGLNLLVKIELVGGRLDIRGADHLGHLLVPPLPCLDLEFLWLRQAIPLPLAVDTEETTHRGHEPSKRDAPVEEKVQVPGKGSQAWRELLQGAPVHDEVGASDEEDG